MENIILTKGDYVELLVNGQVIVLGTIESIEARTYYDEERIIASYVMILIINVTQPYLNVEYVNEGDTHLERIMDLRNNIGKSKSCSMF